MSPENLSSISWLVETEVVRGLEVLKESCRRPGMTKSTTIWSAIRQEGLTYTDTRWWTKGSSESLGDVKRILQKAHLASHLDDFILIMSADVGHNVAQVAGHSPPQLFCSAIFLWFPSRRDQRRFLCTWSHWQERSLQTLNTTEVNDITSQ